MSQRCVICGIDTIFYTWTSSRNFPREDLFKKLNIKRKKMMNAYKKIGYPVCFKCREELNK